MSCSAAARAYRDVVHCQPECVPSGACFVSGFRRAGRPSDQVRAGKQSDSPRRPARSADGLSRKEPGAGHRHGQAAGPGLGREPRRPASRREL